MPAREPTVQRKLTVIVSADVIGYSALMERDEAGTLQRLMANRKSIFDPRVAAHGGRLLDPENYNLMYNLACSMIRLAETDQAIELLAPVFRAAQSQSLNWWKIDSDLDPIRGDPRFRTMLEHAEARLAQSPPTSLA